MYFGEAAEEWYLIMDVFNVILRHSGRVFLRDRKEFVPASRRPVLIIASGYLTISL